MHGTNHLTVRQIWVKPPQMAALNRRPPLLRVPRLYASSFRYRQDMSSEALAAMGYKAEILATGNDDVQRLLADLVANPAEAGLLYDTTFGEGDDVTLTTRTSIKFFAELLRGQVVDRLVRVTNLYGSLTQYCQLVALGPDGFFLCTCLRILTDGLGCRHALRAMLDADLGFTGACVAPRWRDGTMPWTMGPLAAKPAVVATRGTGVPGELPPPPADPSAFSHSKPTVRASGWASCCAFGKELATITAGIDNIPGISRCLENLKNQARQMVQVELRSQHDASTSQVFKGVVTTPTNAREPPEGGGVGTTPGGGSGRGKGGGTGRGGTNGRGRKGSAARGGRAGAVAVVSAAGIQSPTGGLPALQQATGASATGGGARGGGAGVSAVGMPSPGVELPAGAISAGGGASPFQSLDIALLGGMGQASLGLASTAFDTASSSAPESFQQSRLNGEMWHSDNHGQPLPGTPQELAYLDDVQPPQRQKQTGQSRRRTSTRQRDGRGGGQHAIQGGADGAWGGQGGAAGAWS